MKKTLKSLFETFALALAVSGCCVTKINYEKNEKGVVSYRLYRNDHWLKTSASGLRGGMTQDGKFEFFADGMEKSPSEEFNRTMQTYTTAFIQLAQIAAAAYNPSASAASTAAKTAEPAQTIVNVQPAAAVTTSDAQASTNAVGNCSECELQAN